MGFLQQIRETRRDLRQIARATTILARAFGPLIVDDTNALPPTPIISHFEELVKEKNQKGTLLIGSDEDRWSFEQEESRRQELGLADGDEEDG